MSQKRLAIALIIFFALTVSQSLAQSQSSSDGRDFYVAYIQPAFGTPRESHPTVYALIGAYARDSVTITAFDVAGNEVPFTNFVLDSLKTIEIALDPRTLFRANDDLPSFASYRIRSNNPISVQMYSDQNNATELYLALPVNILGVRYRIISYANNAPIVNDYEARSTFLIIAPKDSIFVTITPSCATTVSARNPILLRRGQVLRVRSASGFGQDLTGTLVESSAPVVVLAGHEGAMLPDLSTVEAYQSKYDPLQNLMIEQLRPIISWSSDQYFSIPFAGFPTLANLVAKKSGNLFRGVVAPDKTSPLFQRSALGDNLGSQVGAFSEFDEVTEASETHSSDLTPLDCMQFEYYRGKIDQGITHGFSSPVMMNIIPRTYWKSEYLWRVPASSMYRSGQYLGIIYDQSAIPTVRRDGGVLVLPPSTLSIPGHPELGFTTVRVSPGSFYASAKQPFIVYSYGRSEDNYKVNTGYAAPCGTGGDDNSGSFGLEIDSVCSGWSGILKDEHVRFSGLSQLDIFDSASAKRMRVNPTSNALLAVDSLSDSTRSVRISVVNPSRDANAFLYITISGETRLLKSFHYRSPKLSLSSPIALMRTLVGRDTCTEALIVNNGRSPFTIRSAAVQVRANVFHITGTNTTLPATLNPHDTLRVLLCARTNIPDSLRFDTLVLGGDCADFRVPLAISAIAPRLNWFSNDQDRTLLCGNPDTVRVWLANDNLTDGQETVNNIAITGNDASEFQIVGNQFNYTPLSNFPLNPGDKMWIDVAFHPDMTKADPSRWADRSARIVARNSLHTDPTIGLHAVIGRPLLWIDSSVVDLGSASVGVRSNPTQIVIHDTGNYPLEISRIGISDPRIGLTGLGAGDTIPAGGFRAVTLSAISSVPDTIVAWLTISPGSSCADSQKVLVRFISYFNKAIAPHIESQGLDFPQQFTCARASGQTSFHNTGQTSVNIVSIEIVDDKNHAFSFLDGSHLQVSTLTVAAGETVTSTILALPRLGGSSSARIKYTWDSSGVLVDSYADLSVTASVASASISISSPVGLKGSTPGSEIEIPIQLVVPTPKSLQTGVIEFTLKYRRDLFHFLDIRSAFTASRTQVAEDGAGNELLSFRVASNTGFETAAELLRLRFKVMLAVETSSAVEITRSLFQTSSGDTLCVDLSTTATAFNPDILCGDSLLRIVLDGKNPFTIEAAYPNSVGQSITVRTSSASTRTLLLRILDITGNSRLERSVEIQSGHAESTVSVSGLPSGAYTLTLSDGQRTERKTVFIVR